MTRREAIALARAGVPMRRPNWPTGKTLVFAAGRGTTRAIMVLTISGVVAPAKATDFTQAEFEATDWVQA